jgi:hypothetical protein
VARVPPEAICGWTRPATSMQPMAPCCCQVAPLGAPCGCLIGHSASDDRECSSIARARLASVAGVEYTNLIARGVHQGRGERGQRWISSRAARAAGVQTRSMTAHVQIRIEVNWNQSSQVASRSGQEPFSMSNESIKVGVIRGRTAAPTECCGSGHMCCAAGKLALAPVGAHL